MDFLRSSLKRSGAAVTSGVLDGIRHRNFNKQARAALDTIEDQQGPTDKKSIRLCDEYARDALGSIKYAPWLHVYCSLSGHFKEGWIPDNYYGMVVEPHKCGRAAAMLGAKTLTNRILNTEALPDIAYAIDGVYFSRTFAPIAKPELSSVLFEHDDRVFFKTDGSFRGRGVSIMTARDFQSQDDIRLPDGVFQSPIKQHDFFSAISPQSTATLRITTARELDGTITVRAAYLRLGRSTDEVVKSNSHVRIAVDARTGVLADAGYLHDWRRIEKHPDSSFVFSGQSIPHFGAATALCKTLHESCPHMVCLGWDVCIDQDNKAKLMEWNGRFNDIKFSEATTGPCFLGLNWENLWKHPKP